MQIHEITMRNFGLFQNKTYTFQEGVNLIYGSNESGKTTIHSFITGMLFGIERQRGRIGKENLYLKYRPWESPSLYGGSMVLTYKGKKYRIYRNFSKDEKEYQVTEVQSGRQINVSEQKGSSFMEELTLDRYRNTISHGQLKTGTDEALAVQVNNYLVNMAAARSGSININEAIKSLNEQIKKLPIKEIMQKMSECTEKLREAEQLDKDIANMEQDIEKSDRGQEEIAAKQNMEEIKVLEEYAENFPRIREKYYQYNEIINSSVEKMNIRIFDFVMLAVLAALAAFGFISKYKVFMYSGIILVIVCIFWMLWNFKVRKKKNISEEEYNSKAKKLKLEILYYGNRVFNMREVNSSSMAELEKQVRNLRQMLFNKKSEYQRQSETKRIELERKKWKLEQLLEEQAVLFEEQKTYKEYMKEKWETEQKEQALKIARDTIVDLSAEIHDGFGGNFRDKTEEYVNKLTLGKHSEIELDEKLNIKVLSQGQGMDLSRFSTGTVEQIYLALRLAAGELFFKDERMPLIFDDTFVFYDQNRLDAALWQTAKNTDRQIFIFTCQNREEQELINLSIPYHKIVLN